MEEYDAIVVGAGFGGLMSLHKLLNQHKLNAVIIEKASGVGGTWFHNRYPGALSDTETFAYQYSFDKDLLNDYQWNTKYIHQPEILKYLNYVTDRFHLRQNIKLNTEMISAAYNEYENKWFVKTNSDKTLKCRYLITAVGLLSAINYPDIPGRESFKGELYHTGAWPEHYDFHNKRVGIIGTGSTGNQVITAIASKVKNLTVFQRSPQYCVPAGNGELSEEQVKSIKENYDEIWEGVFNSQVGFGFKESEIPAMSVSAEERQNIFEKAWSQGGGFRFMFATFSDISTNPEANEEAAKFIRAKIAQIVKDPVTAKKLTPYDLYAKRPLCDSGFYDVFNRENVDLIDVKETPIKEIVPNGIITSDNQLHELDALIFATGFDAVDGNYVRINIQGRDGIPIKQHWENGPESLFGTMTDKFPNMFMVLGPVGPFTNLPPTIETQVNWIVDLIIHAEKNSMASVEPTTQSVHAWTKLSEQLGNESLFSKQASWIFGSNVKGKTRSILFYFGGLAEYRKKLKECLSNNFNEYIFSNSCKIKN